MSSSSDDDTVVMVKGTTARASLRLQVEVADLCEIIEGDFLAVKPGSQTRAFIPASFSLESHDEGPFWLCWVIKDAPKPQSKGIKVGWLRTFEPGDEHHMRVRC